MQSSARCSNCGGGDFEYEPPTRHLQIHGGYKGPPHKTFTFGRGVDQYIEIAQSGGWPTVDNYKPRLCCTSCGYWEKTWSPTGEGSPELAGADQAVGSAGYVPGDVVPTQDERGRWDPITSRFLLPSR